MENSTCAVFRAPAMGPGSSPIRPKAGTPCNTIRAAWSGPETYATEWIVGIDDISDFAREQYQNVQTKHYDTLLTPEETIYPVEDMTIAAKLGLSNLNSDS